MRGKIPIEGTPEWDKLVSDFYAGMLVRDLAKRFNAKPQTLLNRFSDVGISKRVHQSIKRRWDKPPVIDGNVLCFCDSQVPFQDSEFFNRILELADVWGVKKGISAGDFLNMGAFSIFGQRPEDRDWSQERKSAQSVITGIMTVLDELTMLLGNHERFLIRAIAEQFDMQDILRLLDRPDAVTATDYFYAICNKTWRITHPRNISVISAKVSDTLCAKFHMNVASGHGHLVGLYPDRSGHYLAVDIGVTCDPMRLDYVSQRDSTRPAQGRGALFLMQGYDGKIHPHLVSPAWTDWHAEKRKYQREV